MTRGRLPGYALLTAILLCGSSALAYAQEEDAPQAEPAPPPTTLPFEPTVPSAPPVRPTYQRPVSPPPPPPPPVDPLCLEIGQIIRAGVVASRFASLSPSTALGGAIGSYETGEALKALGPDYCAVVIPAASPETADSPFNQVTCQLDQAHSETGFLNEYRERQTSLAEEIAACPAMSRWQGEAPLESNAIAANASEDYIFSHPDVALEVVIKAGRHNKTGEWPTARMRTLSLIFRMPNPNRPPPQTGTEGEAAAGQ